jgi:hypothetical protein
MTNFIDTLVARISEGGLASGFDLVGCDESEIRRLESHFDLELPAAYKTFLKTMGHDAGFFMRFADAFYGRLLGNRRAFEEVLALNGAPFTLGHQVFVFFSQQRYLFFCFDTSQHLDDPEVMGYRKGDLELKVYADRFSTFLLGRAEEEIASWAKRPR